MLIQALLFIRSKSLQESNVVLNAETSTNEVQLIQRLDDHGGAVNSVAFGAHRQIASASGLVKKSFLFQQITFEITNSIKYKASKKKGSTYI